MVGLLRRLVSAVERIADQDRILRETLSQQAEIIALQRDQAAKTVAYRDEQRRHMAECAKVFHAQQQQRDAMDTVN